MRELLPIIDWLPRYEFKNLPRDLLGGAAVCAVLIPLGLAYSELAGVYPIIGLYTLPLALVAYAVFGGARLAVVGPDATMAVLVGAMVVDLATNSGEHLALTVIMSILVGIIFIVFFIFKFGWIADLFPDPVLKGFIEGVVWVTIAKQLPTLLGIALPEGTFGLFPTLVELGNSISSISWVTAITGVCCIAVLFAIKKLAPRLPGPLIVLVGSIVAVAALQLSEQNVAVLGEVKGGSFGFSFSEAVDFQAIIELFPGALAIAVLGYTKSIGAFKQAADAAGEQFDPDRELLAMGASNLGAGIAGGYVVGGSLTATSVNIQSGVKTQLGNLFAALLVVLTILFLLPLLRNLAFCVLSAIVVVAMSGLSKPSYFLKAWKVRRFDFFVAMATMGGVLIWDITEGVVIGVVLALFKLADQIHDPETAIVGRTPAGAFVDIDEHEEAEEVPGILIVRQYAPLSFLNARILTAKLREMWKEREDISVVVLDGTASAGMDSTALSAFLGVRNELAEEGIELWVVNIRQKTWNMVVASLELEDAKLPPVFDSLREAVAHYEGLNAKLT